VKLHYFQFSSKTLSWDNFTGNFKSSSSCNEEGNLKHVKNAILLSWGLVYTRELFQHSYLTSKITPHSLLL